MNYGNENPRFVWNIGAIAEQFPDMENVAGTVLWDRQEKKPVLTLHPEYSNAICLETTKPGDAPVSKCEEWFNGIDNEALESEGIAPTT